MVKEGKGRDAVRFRGEQGAGRLDAGSKVFFGWTGRDNPIKLRPILQRRAGCADRMHVAGRSAAVQPRQAAGGRLDAGTAWNPSVSRNPATEPRAVPFARHLAVFFESGID
jgi:hypothetical protein